MAKSTPVFLYEKFLRCWVISLCIYLIPCIAPAQPNWAWAEHAGTGADQHGHDVAGDASGNVFYTGFINGSSNNFDGNFISAVGGNDVFLAKYNSSGNVVWVKGCGGSGDDQGYGITVDTAGFIYVCGFFSGTATFFGSPNITLTSAGGKDIFVAKYNSLGNVLWAKKAGGGGTNDVAYSLCTNGVNVFVTGSFSGTANFGLLPSLVSAGGTDIFIASYDCATGTESWAVKGGGATSDEGHGITADTSGVYVSGYFSNATCTFQNQAGSFASNGNNDIFLVKYDLSGNGIWTRHAGSNGNDQGLSVCVSRSFVYIGGFFNGTMSLYNSGPAVATISNANGDDAFLIQYNSTTGNYNWVRSELGNGIDRSNGISVNPAGFIFSTGYFDGTLPMGSGPSVNSDHEDVFVTAYDSSGTFLWGETADGSDLEIATGVSSPDNISILVSGYFKNGPVLFGSNSISSFNNDDIFIAKLACSTTIANAGPDQTVCASSTNLAGNFVVSGTGTWSLISGTGTITSPGSRNSSVIGLGVGANVFQWTITNGSCGSTSDQVTITRDANPTTANAGIDQTICSSSFSFTGNTPTVGTGLWTLISGTGTITTPASPTSSVTGLSVGANVFQWRISNGTCPPSSDQVTITRDANPTTANAGIDQTICSSSSSFTGNSPTTGTGLWTLISGAGTIVSPTSPTSSVTGLGVGANIFQWTISNGTCPSSSDQVTITRDANPTTANAGIDQTICSSSSSFTGNSPTVGTGIWTLISGSGTIVSPTSPTSIVAGLSIGANVFQWTISNGTCPSSSDQVTITRDANPTIADAGTDQTICSSSVSLAGNSPAIGNGIWALISGSGTIVSPTSPTSSVTGLSVGANIFQWTISNGTCPSSSDQVTITRDANPTTANAGIDQTICSSSSSFTGNSPAIGNGIWTLISGSGIIVSPTSPTSSVTGLSIGANVFQWTISNGTCPSSSDQVTITRDANPTIADAGTDQTICSSSSSFTGNSPTTGTGLWTLISGSGTIVSPTSPTSSVTGLSVGANIFQWTISNGTCPSSSDQVTITRDANPTTANAGIDQTICSSSSSFTGNSPVIGNGIWTLISGSGIIVSPTSPTSSVTGLSVGANVFQWTISNGTCPSSSDQVVINVDANPTTANAGIDQTICSSSSSFTGNSATIGNGTWNLISGTGTITSPTSSTSSVTGLGVGANIFQWTISNGTCPSSSDTVIINIDANPTIANAGSHQNICSSSSSFTGNSPAIGNGIWNLISGSGIIVSPNSGTSAITNLGVGTNVFQWTISNGTCPSSSDTVNIHVDANPTTTNAGADQTICSSTTFLNGNPALVGNGNWTLISGSGTIVSPASGTSLVTNLGTGTNIFQWTISNGTCPSSTDAVFIDVDANPTTANAGSDQTICSSSSSFAGNFAAVGNGIWTLISGSGTIVSPNSETSAITNLSVGTNTFRWTISNGVCPLTFDTVMISVDANPTISNAGIDQAICSSSSSLNGNAATIGNGIWTLLSGNGTIVSPTSPISALTNLGVGTNIFMWTISNGTCPSSTDAVIVDVDANPTIASAGNDQTICSSSSSFNGNFAAIGNGNWNLISGNGTIASANSETSAVTNLGVGANIFQWTISNGTCPSSSDTVIITVDANPTTANAGIDQTICSSLASLNGNAAIIGNGVWTLISGGGTIVSPASATSALTNLSVGINTFQWSISNGTCPVSSDQVTIQVDANPDLSNAGTDVSICSSSDSLHGNIPLVGSGMWYAFNSASLFDNPAFPNASVSNLSVGANGFEWVITNGVCPVTRDTVFINYTQAPSSPVAGPDIYECQNSIVLQAQPPLIGTGYWNNLNNAGIIADTINPNSVVSNIPDGVYYYTWTTSNSYCSSVPDTVAVYIYSPPTLADAGADQLVHTSFVYMHALTPTIGQGMWTLISGEGQIENPADPQTKISSLGKGQNKFQWTTSNGVCTTTSDEIIIDSEPLIIPNGYSPNDDGVNDNFEIVGLLEYKNVSLEVFNRWGNKVFVSPDYRNDWNGVGGNNEILPDDIYYFVLSLEDGSVFNGYVAIKRTKS